MMRFMYWLLCQRGKVLPWYGCTVDGSNTLSHNVLACSSIKVFLFVAYVCSTFYCGAMVNDSS